MSDRSSSNENMSTLTSSNESNSDLSSSCDSLSNVPSSSTNTCRGTKPSRILTTITDEHLITLDELCQRLNLNLETGLSKKQAKKALKKNGDNSFETPARKVTSSIKERLSPSTHRKKFTKTEWDRLVGHRVPTEVQVIRNGARTYILGKNLVVGDIVVLGQNDIVPADIRLINSKDVLVDNRLITGEQMEARTHKVSTTDCLLSPNMVFSCTRVLAGQCVGVVLRTGEGTVFGSLKNFAQRVRFAAVR